MKKILFSILLAFAAVSAIAQVPTYAPQTITMPATVAANSRTNFTSMFLLDTSKQKDLGIGIYISGSTNAIYYLAPTVDGSNYDTNNLKTITIGTGASLTTNYFVTNYTVGGIKGYGLYGISNSAAAVLTNSGTYGIKISAP